MAETSYVHKYKTFLETLTDKIEAEVQRTYGSETRGSLYNIVADWESVLEPHGMPQILAQTGYHRFASPKSYRPSVRPENRASFVDSEPTVRTQPPPVQKLEDRFKSLSPVQIEALKELLRLANVTDSNFQLSQLKSLYRTAAHKTHPDKGGTSESFQQVRNNYQILRALAK